MNDLRLLLALALVTSVAAACSHDHDHDHDHVAGAQATGGEHAHVATHDTDHDGTRDTVATRDDAPTAMDQGESAADVEITRQIRVAVTGDSSLSLGARNCTIITNNGRVWLRGEATSAERATIEGHATRIAGVIAVHNDMTSTDSASAR